MKRTPPSQLRHGHRLRSGRRSPEYTAWINIKERCLNAQRPDFPRYGGAGVAVCDRWRDSFESFLADMGPRPSARHSIDRINNSQGYEPGNCRWATREEQSRNRAAAVLSHSSVGEIWRMRDLGWSSRRIAEELKADPSTIQRVLNGATWRDVSAALGRLTAKEDA